MSSKLKLLLPPLTLFATSGCATVSTAPATVSEYCRIAQPIGYDSEKDTPETVADIERHNSIFACICEADCPQKAE